MESVFCPACGARLGDPAPFGGAASDTVVPLGAVLETSIYAADLDVAADFYGRVLALPLVARAASRHAFFRCGAQMVLVFNPDMTEAPSSAGGPNGGAPRHGARGPGHVAFAVADADLDAWRDRLLGHGVKIEAEVSWPQGGRSLYIRDPAGNSIELASPAIWG